MMPRVGGLELLKALRSDDRLKEVPVILLSARAGEASRIEGLDSGADDYLVKPFAARELLARVGASIELIRIRTEGEQKLRLALARLQDQFELLDEARRQLETADRQKDEFLAMLAHELRNPLSPIFTAAEVLSRSAADQPRSRQAIAAQGGLGIGLSVVKKLLQMHGGEIAARSGGVGKGSTFEIKLPRTEPGIAPVPGAEPRSTPPRRVFIVDDNADAADSLAELLRLDGHEAQAVHSPAEALAQLESFPPDIALLDIGLPDMDGFELARRLRERPALAGVTFVALTGYGQLEDQRRVRESGFDHHLTKPVDLAVLERILAGAVRAPVG
jgi:DNA-binding response OmpR family regulator